MSDLRQSVSLKPQTAENSYPICYSLDGVTSDSIRIAAGNDGYGSRDRIQR